MGEPAVRPDDEWRDKLAIQETMFRYSDALNRADWVALEAVFAPDAVWEMHGPRDRRYESAAAIVANISRLVANVDMMYQTTENPIVTALDGDRATARCAVREMVRETGVAEFVICGIYTDALARVDGAWRFTHRNFRAVYFDPSPLAGRVLHTRDELA
jgi:hypothetical protein